MLQETHSNLADEHKWKKDWVVKLYMLPPEVHVELYIVFSKYITQVHRILLIYSKCINIYKYKSTLYIQALNLMRTC